MLPIAAAIVLPGAEMELQYALVCILLISGLFKRGNGGDLHTRHCHSSKLFGKSILKKSTFCFINDFFQVSSETSHLKKNFFLTNERGKKCLFKSRALESFIFLF